MQYPELSTANSFDSFLSENSTSKKTANVWENNRYILEFVDFQQLIWKQYIVRRLNLISVIDKRSGS